MYSGCRLTSSQEQCGIDCEFNVEFKGFNVDDEVTKLHHLKSITSESYIMACYASTLEKMKFIGKDNCSDHLLLLHSDNIIRM